MANARTNPLTILFSLSEVRTALLAQYRTPLPTRIDRLPALPGCPWPQSLSAPGTLQLQKLIHLLTVSGSWLRSASCCVPRASRHTSRGSAAAAANSDRRSSPDPAFSGPISLSSLPGARLAGLLLARGHTYYEIRTEGRRSRLSSEARRRNASVRRRRRACMQFLVKFFWSLHD